jgi:hypothetical protein
MIATLLLFAPYPKKRAHRQYRQLCGRMNTQSKNICECHAELKWSLPENFRSVPLQFYDRIDMLRQYLSTQKSRR